MPQVLVYIACAPEMIPSPGQYALAFSPGSSFSTGVDAPALGRTLFSTILFESHMNVAAESGFWAAPAERFSYVPGTKIILRGPLGKGFQFSARTRRLGAAALGAQLARLLPMIDQVVGSGGEVALYCDHPLPPGLPPVVEAHPLIALPEVLSWADELVLDVPAQKVDSLIEVFGLSPGRTLPCPGQVLVEIPMPCSGIASCGACSVRTLKGSSLACEEGPVFDLAQLVR